MRYFKEHEFSDYSKMNKELLDRLEILRDLFGSAITITSSYRSPKHPIEAKKNRPGTHAYGEAVDLACIGGTNTLNMVEAAIDAGFKRIGISRKRNFIHVDVGDITRGLPQSIWTY